MLIEVAQTFRSGRYNRRPPLGLLLVQNHSQTAIYLLAPGLKGCTTHQQAGTGEKQPSALSSLWSPSSARHRRVPGGAAGTLRRTLPVAETIADGPMFAGTDAIHTGYTTAVVNGMLGRIDARSLALTGAKRAGIALFHINHRPEKRIVGEETQ